MRSPFAPPLPPQAEDVDDGLRSLGYAYGKLLKAAGAPVSTYSLGGRLKLSRSGWLLLEVPNALVHGLFRAMQEPGVEVPPAKGDFYDAHISVATRDEVESIGGGDRVSERGKIFRYQLGPIKTVEPAGWKEMSKVYFVEVHSPELKKLRVSYGLTPLPNGHEFHITVCVRRRGVLRDGGASKAASRETDEKGDPCPAGECCPHCGARQERGDDGNCNRCGEHWPTGGTCPFDRWVDAHPEVDETGFMYYVAAHNRDDRDDGEMADVSAAEVKRLGERYLSKRATVDLRDADVFFDRLARVSPDNS